MSIIEYVIHLNLLVGSEEVNKVKKNILKYLRVYVNVCSVHYKVCVLEIAVRLWWRERQIKDKPLSKMQQCKLLVRDKIINYMICLFVISWRKIQLWIHRRRWYDIIKWKFRMWDIVVWIGKIWLRIGIGGGHLWVGWLTVGFLQIFGISLIS